MGDALRYKNWIERSLQEDIALESNIYQLNIGILLIFLE
jgi:hypothetical protein